jgi:hypothetical protein
VRAPEFKRLGAFFHSPPKEPRVPHLSLVFL